MTFLPLFYRSLLPFLYQLSYPTLLLLFELFNQSFTTLLQHFYHSLPHFTHLSRFFYHSFITLLPFTALWRTAGFGQKKQAQTSIRLLAKNRQILKSNETSQTCLVCL
jgi:hypothetical protein